MGFFNKLKENFNHGGVKVQLQAPASISMNDATMPVTVTLTSSEQQTVSLVSVIIQGQSHNQGFTQGNSLNQSQSQQVTMARADYAQPVTLMPGESKEIPVTVTINQGAAMAAQLPQDGAMAQVAGMLQKLQSVSEIMNDDSYQYFVEARAKVEGIAFSPSVRQPLQILKPGQFGGAIQKNIHF